LAPLVPLFWRPYAVRQGNKQTEALRVERHIDHDLDVLKELVDLQVASFGRVAAYARLLPADLIPVTRAVYGLPSTPDAVRQVDEREQAYVGEIGMRGRLLANEEALADELVAAIERRVAERPPEPWYRRGITARPRRGLR
jgi:hypothetical protein